MSATLDPIELTSGMILGDEVYRTIGAAILDGRLAPGVRLRDVDLAQQLGISRTPVREALQRLERFGLVEIAVGRYTRVSVPDDKLRHDTGEFTALFMGNALRLAVRSATDAQLAEMLVLADAVVDAAGQADALLLFERSTTMFVAVTRATGNSVFIGIIGEAALAIQRNLRGWVPFMACPIERAAHYTLLRDAIARRDADEAERLLRHLHGVD
ncbi:GntR family transcriptional regulator [Microbacterium telephonicum]|uniref:GntR family transcriptional regulator n=1 Tax=Microbacterium telephonicum TaxID=1714841 RepID=A0A498C8Y4_9MICO|nr:GntR family transcriptional regulator [Microbacterium telephonicum]RLK52222.1 GntR family transcriptional regulator [Microbacterium telephonicum]